MIGQDRTESILRDHLSQLGCQVEPGTKLVSFEQFSDHVEAELSSPMNDEEIIETVRAKWLIGSDGARSKSFIVCFAESVHYLFPSL